MDYFNGVHIRSLTREDFVNRIKPFYLKQGLQADDATLLKIAPILQERIGGLDEAPEIAGFFFQDQVEPPIEDLIQKGLNAEQCADIAARSFEVLSVLPEISARIGEPEMRDLVTEMGLKPAQVFGIPQISGNWTKSQSSII